jgi:hypothetical protein
VKDSKVLPRNAPPLDSLVGFEMTYVTCAGVLARRVEWGQVRDFYDHPGDSDGHSMKGCYVNVFLADGRDLFVHVNDIISVNRPR